MPGKSNTKTRISLWIESSVITVLFIIVSEILHDPLSLASHFPWIWFAPVLIALRYGLWPSQFSLLLLLFYFLYQQPKSIEEVHFQLFFLGGFLLTILCVIFQGVWSKKIADSREISHYLQKRIQTIAYAYKIVSLAYQRIEQNYITKPVTIRSSLSALRELLATSGESTPDSVFNRFLNILALQCSIEIAAIYPVKKNKMITKKITSIGKIQKPNPDDFLIKESLEQTAITYIKVKDIVQGHKSDILIVVPFINQEKEI